MAADQHSVVLHYDPATDKLVVFSIPSTKALALRDRSGFELPVADLRELQHDEAERRVGAGLLQLVESLSKAALGLRDYKAEFEQELERWIRDAEQRPGPYTPQAQFDLAVLYRDLALRKKSQELMGKSKSLTEAAAKAGLQEAAKDLEHWDIYERQFNRRLHEG